MKPHLKTLDWTQSPLIHGDHPDARDIPAGFEGGLCLKEEGIYHLFTTERIGNRGSNKSRLGHWRSDDGDHWQRAGTLVEGTGDETGTDPDAIVWQPTPVFDEIADCWRLFYVAYHHEPEPAIGYHHRKGRIVMRSSAHKGRRGIAGPYTDPVVVLKPDKHSQSWEGDQGVDSFFPYKVGDRWLGLYGSAKTETLPAKACTFWGVGIAEAHNLHGLWSRLPEGNPLSLKFGSRNQYDCMSENPLIFQLAGDLWIGVMDYVSGIWGRETGFVPVNPEIPEDNSIPYIYSRDGLHWEMAGFIELDQLEKRWWTVMRTPLSFIHEGGNRYSVYFTAIKGYWGFAPLGRVTVELSIL